MKMSSCFRDWLVWEWGTGFNRFIMFVTIGIAQYFEYFQHMSLAQSFIVAPSHSGQLAVQYGVSAEFRAEGVVGQVHHGGEFFGRVEHAEGLLGDDWDLGDIHGIFRVLRKIRNLMRNNGGFGIIFYCFGTFRYCFGTFPNDFKFGANYAGIFSYCKGIYLNCEGKISVKNALAQVRKKKFKYLK
jgi:hypothetical protein